MIVRLTAALVWHLRPLLDPTRFCNDIRGLRCVLFHHVSESEDAFTKGLGVSTTPEQFELALDHIVSHYKPVDVQDVIEAANGGGPLPRRPVLITFDDAYRSVAEIAAPILKSKGVPSLFFVNAGFIDNRSLATDNLLAYTFNVVGANTFREYLKRCGFSEMKEKAGLESAIHNYLPHLSKKNLDAFRTFLFAQLGTTDGELAQKANLYVSEDQVRKLPAAGIEIANHSYSHRWGRSMEPIDLEREVVDNALTLARITGKKVRAYSVPYGSENDLTPTVREALERCNIQATFLSDGLQNSATPDMERLHRISFHANTRSEVHWHMEVLPAIRQSIRKLMSRRWNRERDK